jgi:proteasome activator subunit 4
MVAVADAKLPKLPAKAAPAAAAAAGTAGEAEAEAAARRVRLRHARALRRRLGGCLGVAAVVSAHPFDVPPFLPRVLAALARHAADPAPIGATVKRTVADFRRTHQDNFERHAAAFTEEELAEVMGLGSASSYFA